MPSKKINDKISNVSYGKYKDKSFTWVAKNDIEFFKQIEVLYFSKYSSDKKSIYRRVKKRFLENDGLIVVNNYEKEINIVVDLLRSKKTTEQIREYIKTNLKHLKDSNINSIITDANSIVRKDFDLERSYLLDVHLIRYEKLYNDNFKPDLEYVPVGYRKAVMCEHHITAMETLFQKEKLLGVHTKKFKLHANKSVLQRADTDFDFTKLTSNERLELFGYLNKARVTVELVRPIVSNNPLDVDTTKIIEKDTVIEAPVKLSKQTDIKKELEDKELKDKGKNIHEVAETMKKTLEDQVRELFEKKNKK